MKVKVKKRKFKFHNTNPIEVMLEEYRTLRTELLAIHSRQQLNVIQGLVIIGGILAYVTKQWQETRLETLPFLCLAYAIPLCCYTIIVTAAANFARGRQIGEYIACIEKKISRYYKKSFPGPVMEWMNWFLEDNEKPSKKNRTHKAKREVSRLFLRLDLVTMLIFFLVLSIISIYLACRGVEKQRIIYVCSINILFLMASTIIITFCLLYVRESKSKTLKKYRSWRLNKLI